MPEDLLNFGLIPEFIGRLPVLSAVHQLKREDLVQILTEPKNALVQQYQRFFNYDHIDLHFTEDALWSIADKALTRETGARGLRSIIENALLDVMFELPSRKDVTKCVITKETIEKGLKPTLVTSAGAALDDGRARRRVGVASPSASGIPGRRPAIAASGVFQTPDAHLEPADLRPAPGRPGPVDEPPQELRHRKARPVRLPVQHVVLAIGQRDLKAPGHVM